MRRADFGTDFTWGVASAAYQIEGAWDLDGKRPSVWDEAGRRGRIAGGRVGDDAIDFYHRYPADLDLIAELGFGANRFSLSWPRLMGDGDGPPNPKGVDFYNKVIDGCLERGLDPWVTVHHWDLPQAMYATGGWTERSVIERFANFAEFCATTFGDRVKHWMVFNEPASVAGHLLIGGYGRLGLYPRRTLRCVHHMNVAIAEGARRMRAALPAGADIGTTNIVTLARPYEPTDEHTRRRKAAIEALTTDMFVDPAGGLGYPFHKNRLLKHLEPAILDGDLEAATFRFDFMGLQYYGPVVLRKQPIPGLGPVPTFSVPNPEVKLRSDIGIPADPEGLLHVLRRFKDHPAADRLVVTEAGIGLQDRMHDGEVNDDVRIWYVREHLRSVLAARNEGIPVDGFFHWSYADNIEWFFGRRPRFGLVHIDYENDFARTPKASARWFQRFLTDTD